MSLTSLTREALVGMWKIHLMFKHGVRIRRLFFVQVFDGGPVGLGTMTVVHAEERAEGSEMILPGVNAGGFDSLVKLTRQVRPRE